MDIGSLDLRQLRQIAEICRAGGVTRAAHMLGISQPTLSKSIRRIEDQLGVPLFDVRGRSLVPNVLAHHIASRSAAILENVEKVGREVRAIASGHGAPLRIGVGAASRHLCDRIVLADLLKMSPHLRIEMHQDVVPNLMQRVRSSELDVVITSHRRDAAPRGLVSLAVLQDDVYFVARANHPLRGCRDADVPRFLEYPIASPGLYFDFQRALPTTLNDAQTRNATAYVCQDYSSIFDMVLASDSITYAPWFIIDRLCTPDNVVVLNAKMRLSYYSYIFVNEIAASSPFIRGSVEVIRRSIATAYEDGMRSAKTRRLEFGITDGYSASN
ncbi:LysR family transcriptional regulator [Tsuneonella dongtanensis]|nr:LysR family transcriptional regulator [Tsuneonella dongtanensis]